MYKERILTKRRSCKINIRSQTITRDIIPTEPRATLPRDTHVTTDKYSLQRETIDGLWAMLREPTMKN